MGILYYADGTVAAVFENGVVYKDSRKTTVLGRYENGKIYSGTTKFWIGSFFGNTIYGYRDAVGQIMGSTIFSGKNSLFSDKVGFFYGELDGAAAAALLSGMFKKCDLKEIQKESYKKTYLKLLSSILSVIIVVSLLYSSYATIIKKLAGINFNDFRILIASLIALLIGTIYGNSCYSTETKFTQRFATIYWSSTMLSSIAMIAYHMFFDGTSFGLVNTILLPIIVMIFVNLVTTLVSITINKLLKV